MEKLLEKGESIQDKEREFFNKLYLRYAKDIYSLARRKINNVHDAEDIKQNVFVTLLAKIKTVYNHPDPGGWLFQVAENQIKHYWRYMARKNKVEAEISSAEMMSDDTEMYQGMTYEVLQEHLTDEERQMFLWFYVEGLSLKEISVRRGITYGTCRVYMTHMRARMKKIINSD